MLGRVTFGPRFLLYSVLDRCLSTGNAQSYSMLDIWQLLPFIATPQHPTFSSPALFLLRSSGYHSPRTFSLLPSSSAQGDHMSSSYCQICALSDVRCPSIILAWRALLWSPPPRCLGLKIGGVIAVLWFPCGTGDSSLWGSVPTCKWNPGGRGVYNWYTLSDGSDILISICFPLHLSPLFHSYAGCHWRPINTQTSMFPLITESSVPVGPISQDLRIKFTRNQQSRQTIVLVPCSGFTCDPGMLDDSMRALQPSSYPDLDK